MCAIFKTLDSADEMLPNGMPRNNITINGATELVGVQITSAAPREELSFIVKLKSLLGNEAMNVKAKVIPNIPENEHAIKGYSLLQSRAVNNGGKEADEFIKSKL